MEFYISGSLDYKWKQKFCLQGVLVGSFFPQNDQWPACSQPRWYFCLKLWKGGSQTTCLEWKRRDEPHSSHRQMPSPCTAASREECLKQQDMHSQECCTPTGPKCPKLLLSPFLLCSCKCPKFITSTLMETVFLPIKIFPNTSSHCMLKVFLASKWSYLLPALVAVGAWRGRAGTGLGRAQGCASHCPHPVCPGIINCSGLLGSKRRDSSPRTGQIGCF